MENMEMARGLSREDRQELTCLLNRFIDSYGEKPAVQTDEEWLRGRLMAELPELGADAAAAYSREMETSIRTYDEALSSLKQAHSRGKTTAEWFFRRTRQSCRSMSDAEYAAGVLALHTALEGLTGVNSGDGGKTAQILPAGNAELRDAKVRELAQKAGKQVELASYQSVVHFTEYVTEDTDRPGQENGAVVRALESGETAGLKTAVAGALTAAAEKKVIRITSSETKTTVISANLFANMAGMAVENARTDMRMAKRKISAEEAVNEKAANAAVAITNIGIKTIGRGIGGILGSIPVVGPVIRSACMEATNTVINRAAPKVREAVTKANGAVATFAKKKVAQITDVLNSAKEKAVGFFKSVTNKVATWVR